MGLRQTLFRKPLENEQAATLRSPPGVTRGSSGVAPTQVSPRSSNRSLIGVDFARGARVSSAPTEVSGGRPARLLMLGALALVWVCGLVWRLYSLQVSDVQTWRQWAVKQHAAELEVAAVRGPIVDRNGKLLAVSVPAGSVYVRPRQVSDCNKVVSSLAEVLEMPAAQVRERLDSKQPFVWVKRQLPRYQSDRVEALGLTGVGVVMESRRYYPYNQASSALIGKVGLDGVGLSGTESLFEKRLHVDHVTTKATRDAFGNLIHLASDGGSFSIPKGHELRLTIDADLQIIMDEELEQGRKDANAKQAMAVVIDSDTGEVVAMSQSPSYNFNLPNNDSKNALKNLLVEAVFEPGSIMKPVVAAAALDAGVVRPSELIDCENGRFRYSTHTIKDVHGAGTIPFHEVIARSSNIGMTKVGLRLGNDRLYRYLRAFGFGSSTNLGLAGESAGILRAVDRWAKIDVATHSFGQGVAVTPLQMVRSVAAIANGGVLPQLSVVVADDGVPQGKRVVSQRAAEMARDMMYEVVESEHGTGGKAKVPGLRVGGKTGTAQKASPHGRGYQPGAYVASFVGFVDGSPLGVNRNLTAMVVIDEPRAKSIYGGTLAAPVFSRVMDRSFRFLATRSTLGITPKLIPPEESLEEPIDLGKPNPIVPASFKE